MDDTAAMETATSTAEAAEAVPVTECKSGGIQEEAGDVDFKKPGDPFKVPVVTEARSNEKLRFVETEPQKATSAPDGQSAADAGGSDSPSAGPDPTEGPDSDGFTAPSCPAPRLPASGRFKSPAGPAAPPPKPSASKSNEPVKPSAPTKPRPPVASAPGAERRGPAGAAAAGPPPFRPPPWAGRPPAPFSLEVLRGGRIVDTVPLADRSWVLFGRLVDCDVRLEHPSISRHHAALVYRASAEAGHEAGYYLYDLGSTHGSTLNKTPVPPRVYCRMRVGHMCKFGGSTRLFILQGPDDDREEESQLTVTELKELGQRRQERQRQEQERLDALDDRETDSESSPAGLAAPAPAAAAAAAPAAAAEDGISWGMAEDADEESDLQFNPFALGEAENEQLYLVDPKRTLRGWFEREGFELEYQTEDLPGGRHVCRITLPLDTADGRPPVAEAQHVGKKKEAVFQCALEACRLLDRAGVLRQAKQESRQKRRQKPAGYDSDEDDTFLDRTGTVERKRQRRQEAAGGAKTEQKADTYQSLLLQYQRVQSEALAVERSIAELETAAAPPPDQSEPGVDELDAFMTRLSRGALSDRQQKRKLKTQLTHLRSEEGRLCRLVNLARPASLPALKPPPQVAAVRSPLTGMIGKKKGKSGGATRSAAAAAVTPQRSTPTVTPAEKEEEEEEEVGGGGEKDVAEREDCAARLNPAAGSTVDSGGGSAAGARELRSGGRAVGPDGPPPSCGDDPTQAEKRQRPARESDCPSPAEDRERQQRGPVRRPVYRPAANEVSDTAVREGRPRQPGGNALRKGMSNNDQNTEQPAEAADPYCQLAGDGTYDVWVPPENQSGDGRTSLNDKLGY